MINEIIKSFREMLRNISDLKMFTYTESNIDIDEVVNGRVKVDLPLGTETTFIIQANIDGSWYDVRNTKEEVYDYLNRYIKITLPSGGDEQYFLITSINESTNEITIDRPFGEAITTTDTFEIAVLDSIFVKSIDKGDMGGQNNFNKKFTRLDMTMKTKLDSNRVKINDYIQEIESVIGQYRNMVIYADDLVTELGYGFFRDSGSYNETVDSADQLVVLLGSLRIEYYVDNFA